MATVVNVTPASQLTSVEVINRNILVSVQKEIKSVDVVIEARNNLELVISRAVSPGVVSIYGSENINVSSHTGNVTVSFTSPNGFTSGGNIIAPYFLGNVVGNISGNIVVPGLQGDVLFNDGGNAGASDNLQFNKNTNVLTVTGNIVATNITANVMGNVSGTVTGNIQPTYVLGNLIPNANVTYNLGNSTNRFKDLYLAGNTIYLGNYQIDTNTSGITMSGNLTVGNVNMIGKISGDGSLLSNITGANVSGTVANATYALNAGNAYSVTGSNVSGQVANALIAGTVYTNAQPNITSVGTLTSLTVSGDATVAGNLAINGNLTYVNVTNLNVQDPVIEMGGGPNGAPLTTNDGKDRGTLLHYYTTEPINAFMGWDNSGSEFIFGSNVTNTNDVVTVNNYGNVHANYFKGNASQLTGTIANAGYAIAAGSATTAGTVTIAAQPNITSVGTLTSIDVTSNVTAGNIKSDHLLYANGSPYVFTTNAAGANTQIQFNDDNSFAGSSNLTFNKTTGTFTSQYLVGDGTGISNVAATNIVGEVANAAYAANAGYADYALVAYSVDGANVIGEVANATYATTSGTSYSIDGANVSGEVANATYATTSGTSYSIDGANVLGEVANATYATTSGSSDTANFATSATSATTATVAYEVSGANVIGAVATAGTADYASVAFSVDGANVSGTVADATYATTSGTSYSIDGANVIGEVANATYATTSGTSYSIDGANVSGEVANATYAGHAGYADAATEAYSVDVANVSGIGNIATINLDGNVSNVLAGDGTFIAMSGGGSGTPGGNTTELQFNNAGSFGGIETVTYASGNLSLGNVANVKVSGGTSNTFISTDGAGNLSFLPITSNLTVGTRSTAVNIGISNYTMNVESRTGNVTVNVN